MPRRLGTCKATQRRGEGANGRACGRRCGRKIKRDRGGDDGGVVGVATQNEECEASELSEVAARDVGARGRRRSATSGLWRGLILYRRVVRGARTVAYGRNVTCVAGNDSRANGGSVPSSLIRYTLCAGCPGEAWQHEGRCASSGPFRRWVRCNCLFCPVRTTGVLLFCRDACVCTRGSFVPHLFCVALRLVGEPLVLRLIFGWRGGCGDTVVLFFEAPAGDMVTARIDRRLTSRSVRGLD